MKITMELTKEQILEFKDLYKKHFWVELSEQDALAKCLDLVISVKNVLFLDFENNDRSN